MLEIPINIGPINHRHVDNKIARVGTNCLCQYFSSKITLISRKSNAQSIPLKNDDRVYSSIVISLLCFSLIQRVHCDPAAAVMQ